LQRSLVLREKQRERRASQQLLDNTAANGGGFLKGRGAGEVTNVAAADPHALVRSGSKLEQHPIIARMHSIPQLMVPVNSDAAAVAVAPLALDPSSSFGVKKSEMAKTGRPPQKSAKQRCGDRCMACMSVVPALPGFIRRPIQSVVRSIWFEVFAILVVVANAVLLGFDHFDMTPAEESVLRNGNYVLTALFALELVMRCVVVWC
jgi:hypothetical protein